MSDAPTVSTTTASATPAETTAGDDGFRSSEFAVSLTTTLPEGWEPTERSASLSFFNRTGAEGEGPGHRVLIVVQSEHRVVEPDGGKPWPDDLHAWLMRHASFEPAAPEPVRLGGVKATAIEATSEWTPESGARDVQQIIVSLDAAAGAIEGIYPGMMRWRFIEVEPPGQPAITIVMSAWHDEFEPI